MYGARRNQKGMSFEILNEFISIISLYEKIVRLEAAATEAGLGWPPNVGRKYSPSM